MRPLGREEDLRFGPEPARFALVPFFTAERREPFFFRPAGWGSPKAPFDPKTVVGLNFTSKGGIPWDFTIDDLKFTQ